MRHIIVILVMLFFASPCYAEDLYLNSACTEGCDGTTVEKGWAAPADVQWASSNTVGKVDAGDTLHIYGTHATTLTVGASGNGTDGVITIKFESGSSFEKAYWGAYNVAPAIRIDKNYITIDGNSLGLIKSTDNGWKKTNKQDSAGIGFEGDYITVKNLTISDIYVYDSTAEDPDDGASAYAIFGLGSHINIYGNTIDQGWKAILVGYGASEVDVNIYNNTITHYGVGITVGSGGAGSDLTGVKIYGNNIAIGDNFCGSAVHQDGIHVFAKHSSDNHVTNLEIYNNTITRNVLCGGLTTYIYQEGNPGKIISPLTYNNLLYTTTGISTAHDGVVYTKNNVSPVFYNNTIYGHGTTHGFLFSTSRDIIMKGNIIHSCDANVTIGSEEKTITGAADNGSGLIRLTFALGHGYGAGQSILATVSGVGGTTEANGDQQLLYIDANNLDILGSTFVHEYTSGGKITDGRIADSGAGMDYNVYYNASGFNASYLGSTKTSIGTWQSATSADGNTVTSNPELVDVESDHNLTSSTPEAVRDSTQWGSITTDIEGTTRSYYSMGAYEYGGPDPVLAIDMADPHVRTTQYLYCTVTGVNSGDKLKVTLDGGSIYNAAATEGINTVTATYTSLTAGEHTLRFVVTNSADSEYASTVQTEVWTTTHNGAPTVGINKDNAIVIGGALYFPIMDYMVDYSKISGNLWDVTNTSHTQGYIASDKSTLTGWKAWLDAYQANSRRVIGPNGSWEGYDATKQGLADMDKMTGNNSNCSTPSDSGDCSYVNYTKSHVGLFAWIWEDESNLAATDITYPTNTSPLTGLKEWKDAVRVKDTNHPTMTGIAGIEDNYVSTIYPGLQALTKTYTYVYGGVQIADIWGMDYYPYEYRGYVAAPSLEEWGESIDNALIFNKGLFPVFATTEIGDISDMKGRVVYGWSSGTSYPQNTRRLESLKSYRQYNAGTCTSGGSEPTWPTTIGETVADNTCAWVCEGTVSNKAMNIATWDSGDFTLGERVCATSGGCAVAGGYLGVLNPLYPGETAASYIRKPAVLNNYPINQLVFSSIDGTFTTGMSITGQSSSATATTHGTTLWGKTAYNGQSDRNYDWSPAPIAAQVGNLVWLGIIHGLSGIGYFDYFFSAMIDATVWTILGTAKTYIEDLKDVILQPVSSKITPTTYTKWAAATVADARVDYTVRDYGTTTYIIAARVKQKTGESTAWPDPTNTDSKTATIAISGMTSGKTITVYGESRTLTSGNGSFQDDFLDYDYHIYYYTDEESGGSTSGWGTGTATHKWGTGSSSGSTVTWQ